MQDKYRAVTPILIPLINKADVGCLLQKSKVEFNLDGNGERECTEWLANDAGWLVYNSDQKGNINSGLSLIGEVTFWVFWKN